MTGKELEKKAIKFAERMVEAKKKIDPAFPWYPYGSMGNFFHLKRIFDKCPLNTLMGSETRTVDIGAADGDLSFFLETLGYHSDIIDYPPTNFNHLRGAKLLKEHFGSSMNIYEKDLDSQFSGLDTKYGLVIFLGILYHLKNPYYVLEKLSQGTKYLLVSTRIAKWTKDNTRISENSLAYLLAPDECNNDSTNYWIFSYKGLERLFTRTGWEIVDMFSVGDTDRSNPSDQNHDERAFALLKSRS